MLALPQGRLRLLPGGAVDNRGKQILGIPLGIPQQRHHHLSPDDFPVFPKIAFLHGVVMEFACQQLLLQPQIFP